MIEKAFLHFKGVGTKVREKLEEEGIQDWKHFLQYNKEDKKLQRLAGNLQFELQRYLKAKEEKDIAFFVKHIHPKERFLLLAEYFDDLSFFDIETNGQTWGDCITTIACFHKGKIYNFVSGENMEEFLQLLEDVKLLVSFNGASFDIPIVLQYYHIPYLVCPHIDLRWVCHYAGIRGGLKLIEKIFGIKRPANLEGVDGLDAIILWHNWITRKDRSSREKLIRYCSCDAISLKILCTEILKEYGYTHFSVDSKSLFKLLE
ncbi:MAG: ribonuclease H-like domain-containing protein [Leptospiraceae bacterium]|nr:ribonuclease H-like domain-containing protein [Leptospiraceae bacterium]MCP5503299.1 ribonuclease H-like domain-containing protein [Leptospiraceae bacterium]